MAVCVEVDGEWFIQEPVILKQEISGGNCELDKTALANYYTEYGMKYKNTTLDSYGGIHIIQWVLLV